MDPVDGWRQWKLNEGLDISVLNDAYHLSEYVLNVLKIMEQADQYESMLWRVDGEKVTFALMCSDTFAWGCADAEEILPGDLPLLWQTWQDLKAVEAAHRGSQALCDLPELYAARKRGMRPMNAWITTQDGTRKKPAGTAPKPEWEPVKALFYAAGPERESTWTAP